MNQQRMAIGGTQKHSARSGSNWPPRRIEPCIVDQLLAYGHAHDNTDYARSIGYDGDRRVILLDGKVISHRWLDWFAFCAACRSRARRKLH